MLKSKFKKIISKFSISSTKHAHSIISKIPRYEPCFTTLFSHKLKIIDSASFLAQYRGIFDKEIYKFNTTTSRPFILDCGANIGLSIIYFKRLYPQSKIIGFEPDEKAFEALTYNMNSFKFKNITLINKAVWTKKSLLPFFSEGADAGRIAVKCDHKKITEIQTIRLKDFLNTDVDFLKIDIEGAETKILDDCSSLLFRVKHLFVEYHSFANMPQSLDKILKILTDASFRYYLSSSGVHSPQPFIQKNEYLGMDNQINIYATRN